MAEFKLGRIRFVWKGAWYTGTIYSVDDVVRYGGRTYICVVNHTANASFQVDLTAANWALMSDGQEWKGDWNQFQNLNQLRQMTWRVQHP